MDFSIIKYPSTPHLVGSEKQAGDEGYKFIPFSEILNKNIVIEEKIDGANCAISFNDQGELLLQSRGHYLRGGVRERNFNLFKSFANENKIALFNALSFRYVMYGEWMYAMHTVFYDSLPAYFIEFDILDRFTGEFLSTERRKEITQPLGIHSVPVLASGVFKSEKSILEYLGNSNYISAKCGETFVNHVEKLKIPKEYLPNLSAITQKMEGLYIKVEENGVVKNRVKFVRSGFRQKSSEPEKDWFSKPIITNLLTN